MNTSSVSLLLLMIVKYGIFEFDQINTLRKFILDDIGSISILHIEPNAEVSSSTVDLPDIYYIILDGYGRGDILEQNYNYGNSKLLGFLDDRGFYIANLS